MSRVSTEDFDTFVDGLDYPVFVVTTGVDGDRAGALVGFTTQTSIDPPRMLVCLSTANHTFEVAERADLLAVHVLDPGQRDLAELFGGETGDHTDKFARCRWSAGPGGVPLLEDCPRRFVGRILDRHPFGDHVGYLLEPVALDLKQTGPALSFSQARGIDPGHSA